MGDAGACPCVFTMRRRRYFEKQTNQEAAERPACRHDGCKCNGYGLGGQFCTAKCIAGSNRRRSSVHHGQTRRDHRPSCQSRQQHGNWLRHRRLSSRQKRGALHLPVPFEQVRGRNCLNLLRTGSKDRGDLRWSQIVDYGDHTIILSQSLRCKHCNKESIQ